MTMRPLLLIACSIALLAGGADAQAQARPGNASKGGKTSAKQGKIYRWVDAKGQTHYDDALPQEALARERVEYRKNGRVAAQIPGTVAPSTPKTADPAPAASASTKPGSAPVGGGAQPGATANTGSIASTGAEPPGNTPGAVQAGQAAGMSDPQAQRADLGVQLKALQQAIAKAQPTLLARLDQAAALELAEKPVPAALVAQIRQLGQAQQARRQDATRTQDALRALDAPAPQAPTTAPAEAGS